MTGRRFGLLSVTAAVMALLLAACGADPTVTPTSVPTATPLPQATPTPTPDAAALFRAEWDALIKAAQDEGELSITAGGSAGRNFRAIIGLWGEQFGITPIIATGSGNAHVNRVLAERNVGRYLVDVMYGGGSSLIARLIPANALVPIADLFMHPEVADQSLWLGGKHWYADPQQQFIFVFSASARPMTLGMRYNTDLVTQEDIDNFNSVFDYLDPRWKGKIVAFSPTAGGSSGTYYAVYVHPDIGPEWIDRFLSPELDVTFAEDIRFIADGMAHGKFHIAIGGGAVSDLDALAALGAPIGVLTKDFKEGGELAASSSGSLMSVVADRPHPNATKLWVNWWLSKEGQTQMHTMSEVNPKPTLREDVTDWGKTEELDRRVPGQSYYFLDADPALVERRQEALDYVASAYRASR